MTIKLLTHWLYTGCILSLITINLSIQKSLDCTRTSSETKLIYPLFITGEIGHYFDNEKFTDSLAELYIPAALRESKIYNYSIHATKNAVFFHAILKPGVSGFHSIKRKPGFWEWFTHSIIYMYRPGLCSWQPSSKIPYKSYILAVVTTSSEGNFKNVACQADNMGSVQLKEPFLQGDKPVCAEGSSIWQEVDLLP